MKLTKNTVLISLVFITIFLFISRFGFSINTYPWYFPDSYDWIANGIRYANPIVEFEISHRAMMLPLALAILYKFELQDLISYYGLFFFVICALIIYKYISLLIDKKTALISGLFYTFSFTILSQSAYVGSDIAANTFLSLFGLSTLAYFKTNEKKHLLISALSLGLGLNAQYIIPIFLPVPLLFLFIKEKQDRITITFNRLLDLIKAKLFYCSAFLAFISGFILLYPRLHEFKIIYTEKVQHGSLIYLHFNEIGYNIFGLFANFSWPIIALAVLGLIYGLKQNKYITLYMAAWILSIYSFFTLLYDWADIRLLIYSSTAIFLLAAIGLKNFIEKIDDMGIKEKNKNYLKIGLTIFVFLYLQSPSTLDPFDNAFALTPMHELSYSQNQGLSITTKYIKPYLIGHFVQTKLKRLELQNNDIDTATISEPLIRIFDKLKNKYKNDEIFKNIFYFDKISPAEIYYVRNRNIIYLDSSVQTFNDLTTLQQNLPETNFILIYKKDSIAWKNIKELIMEDGPYIVAKLNKNDNSIEITTTKLEYISEIKAQEFGEKLFDRIKDSADNFAASPNLSPIEIIFSFPQNLKEIKFYLYDFDDRYYNYNVEASVNNSWELIVDHSTVESKGLQTIEMPNKQYSAIRITGLYNSDQQNNPNNNIIHIKEIEFVK